MSTTELPPPPDPDLPHPKPHSSPNPHNPSQSAQPEQISTRPLPENSIDPDIDSLYESYLPKSISPEEYSKLLKNKPNVFPFQPSYNVFYYLDAYNSAQITRLIVHKWMALIMSAMFVGIVCVGIRIAVRRTNIWKYSIVDHFLEQYGQTGNIADYAYAVLVLVAFCFFSMLISALIILYVAPGALGSGVVTIKAFLNGMNVRDFFTLKLLFFKTLVTILTAFSGIPTGTQSSLIHIGSMSYGVIASNYQRIANLLLCCRTGGKYQEFETLPPYIANSYQPPPHHPPPPQQHQRHQDNRYGPQDQHPSSHPTQQASQHDDQLAEMSQYERVMMTTQIYPLETHKQLNPHFYPNSNRLPSSHFSHHYLNLIKHYPTHTMVIAPPTYALFNLKSEPILPHHIDKYSFDRDFNNILPVTSRGRIVMAYQTGLISDKIETDITNQLTQFFLQYIYYLALFHQNWVPDVHGEVHQQPIPITLNLPLHSINPNPNKAPSISSLNPADALQTAQVGEVSSPLLSQPHQNIAQNTNPTRRTGRAHTLQPDFSRDGSLELSSDQFFPTTTATTTTTNLFAPPSLQQQYTRTNLLNLNNPRNINSNYSHHPSHHQPSSPISQDLVQQSNPHSIDTNRQFDNQQSPRPPLHPSLSPFTLPTSPYPADITSPQSPYALPGPVQLYTGTFLDPYRAQQQQRLEAMISQILTTSTVSHDDPTHPSRNPYLAAFLSNQIILQHQQQQQGQSQHHQLQQFPRERRQMGKCDDFGPFFPSNQLTNSISSHDGSRNINPIQPYQSNSNQLNTIEPSTTNRQFFETPTTSTNLVNTVQLSPLLESDIESPTQQGRTTAKLSLPQDPFQASSRSSSHVAQFYHKYYDFLDPVVNSNSECALSQNRSHTSDPSKPPSFQKEYLFNLDHTDIDLASPYLPASKFYSYLKHLSTQNHVPPPSKNNNCYPSNQPSSQDSEQPLLYSPPPQSDFNPNQSSHTPTTQPSQKLSSLIPHSPSPYATSSHRHHPRRFRVLSQDRPLTHLTHPNRFTFEFPQSSSLLPRHDSFQFNQHDPSGQQDLHPSLVSPPLPHTNTSSDSTSNTRSPFFQSPAPSQTALSSTLSGHSHRPVLNFKPTQRTGLKVRDDAPHDFSHHTSRPTILFLQQQKQDLQHDQDSRETPFSSQLTSPNPSGTRLRGTSSFSAHGRSSGNAAHLNNNSNPFPLHPAQRYHQQLTFNYDSLRLEPHNHRRNQDNYDSDHSEHNFLGLDEKSYLELQQLKIPTQIEIESSQLISQRLPNDLLYDQLDGIDDEQPQLQQQQQRRQQQQQQQQIRSDQPQPPISRDSFTIYPSAFELACGLGYLDPSNQSNQPNLHQHLEEYHTIPRLFHAGGDNEKTDGTIVSTTNANVASDDNLTTPNSQTHPTVPFVPSHPIDINNDDQHDNSLSTSNNQLCVDPDSDFASLTQNLSQLGSRTSLQVDHPSVLAPFVDPTAQQPQASSKQISSSQQLLDFAPFVSQPNHFHLYPTPTLPLPNPNPPNLAAPSPFASQSNRNPRRSGRSNSTPPNPPNPNPGHPNAPPRRPKPSSFYIPHIADNETLRLFVALGVVAGISSSTGSLFGAILYALEDVVTFSGPTFTPKAILSVIIVAFCVFWGRSLDFGFGSVITRLSISQYYPGNFYVQFHWEDLALSFILGIFVAMIGHLYIKTQQIISKYRGKWFGAKQWYKIIDSTIVSLIWVLLAVFIPLVYSCDPTPPEYHEYALLQPTWISDRHFTYKQFICPVDQHNELASMFISTATGTIRRLLARHVPHFLQPRTIAIFGVLYFFGCAFTSQTTSGVGSVVPTLTLGATCGRLIGCLYYYLFSQNPRSLLVLVEDNQQFYDPGIYAICGSVALFVTLQSSIMFGLVVIEMIGDIDLIILSTCAAMSALVVKHALIFYNTHDVAPTINPHEAALISVKKVPFIHSSAAGVIPKELHLLNTVDNLMNKNVVMFGVLEQLWYIVFILQNTQFSYFPVVFNPCRCKTLKKVYHDKLSKYCREIGLNFDEIPKCASTTGHICVNKCLIGNSDQCSCDYPVKNTYIGSISRTTIITMINQRVWRRIEGVRLTYSQFSYMKYRQLVPIEEIQARLLLPMCDNSCPQTQSSPPPNHVSTPSLPLQTQTPSPSPQHNPTEQNVHSDDQSATAPPITTTSPATPTVATTPPRTLNRSTFHHSSFHSVTRSETTNIPSIRRQGCVPAGLSRTDSHLTAGPNQNPDPLTKQTSTGSNTDLNTPINNSVDHDHDHKPLPDHNHDVWHINDYSAFIDLTVFSNRSHLFVLTTTSTETIYNLFSSMQCNVILVINNWNEIVGIVTRFELIQDVVKSKYADMMRQTYEKHKHAIIVQKESNDGSTTAPILSARDLHRSLNMLRLEDYLDRSTSLDIHQVPHQ